MSGMEIERKYLVRDDSYKQLAHRSFRIRQGYLYSGGGRPSVRVRRRDDEALLTIKGPSRDGGLSRYEFETPITLDEADHLFQLCEPGLIDKTRYLVRYEGHTFEVDEFHGDNQGLVVAEVELKSADEVAKTPDFIGPEVTGQHRYYNSQLRRRPYATWMDNKQ